MAIIDYDDWRKSLCSFVISDIENIDEFESRLKIPGFYHFGLAQQTNQLTAFLPPIAAVIKHLL